MTLEDQQPISMDEIQTDPATKHYEQDIQPLPIIPTPTPTPALPAPTYNHLVKLDVDLHKEIRIAQSLIQRCRLVAVNTPESNDLIKGLHERVVWMEEVETYVGRAVVTFPIAQTLKTEMLKLTTKMTGELRTCITLLSDPLGLHPEIEGMPCIETSRFFLGMSIYSDAYRQCRNPLRASTH